MTIFYRFDGKLYANITNKCPCACTFCIRKGGDSIAGNDSLWLEHEPDTDEIIQAFNDADKTDINEVVFCGYGEPMERIDVLMEVAGYIKTNSKMRIRINTNGLVGFMNPRFDIYSMKGLIDSISISLNASDPDKYLAVTNSKFGLPSYNSMLNFAILAKSCIKDVTFTVVDTGNMDDEIEACRVRASDLDIPLRIRPYVSDNVEYK